MEQRYDAVLMVIRDGFRVRFWPLPRAGGVWPLIVEPLRARPLSETNSPTPRSNSLVVGSFPSEPT